MAALDNIGKSGRVIATIRPGKEGEVLLELRGGTSAFPARAADPKEEIVAGSQVWVSDQLGRCVYVTT